MVNIKHGKYEVIGKGTQRVFNGQTQPFIQHQNNVEIKRKEPFFISGAPEKKENKFKSSIVNNCQFVNAYTLTTQDKTAINKIYPNFSFKYLSEFSYNGHKNNVTNGEKMIYTFYRRLRLIEEISKILL